MGAIRVPGPRPGRPRAGRSRAALASGILAFLALQLGLSYAIERWLPQLRDPVCGDSPQEDLELLHRGPRREIDGPDRPRLAAACRVDGDRLVAPAGVDLVRVGAVPQERMIYRRLLGPLALIEPAPHAALTSKLAMTTEAHSVTAIAPREHPNHMIDLRKATR